MGRTQELLDELIREAPQGALNAAKIILWILGVVLALLVLIALGVLVWAGVR